MVTSSAIAGLIGLVLSYALAIPLGSYMARFKDTLFDSVLTGILTFLLSLPTIALVYIVRLMGSAIGLPDSFPILGAGDWRSYVLPSVILGILSTPGLAIWIRRHKTSFVLHVPKDCQNKKFQTSTFSRMLWFPWFQEFQHLLLGLSQGQP